MKFSSLFSMLLIFASQQAFAANTEIKLKNNATVVQVHVKTARAHNCPSSLNLQAQYQGENHILVNHNQVRAQTISQIKQNISESCSEEIENYERDLMRMPVCLSYGFSTGEVFIDVSAWDKSKNLKLSIPKGLKIESVVQHQKIESAQVDIDCENEPEAVMCCAAMTPSCIACKDNARRIRAEWEAMCR